jgi:hypothetical protein
MLVWAQLLDDNTVVWTKTGFSNYRAALAVLNQLSGKLEAVVMSETHPSGLPRGQIPCL